MTTGEVIALIKAFGGSGGGGGGASAFYVSDTDGTLNKTWAEINAALQTSVVVLDLGGDFSYLKSIWSEDGVYGVAFILISPDAQQPFQGLGYVTDRADGYPAYING